MPTVFTSAQRQVYDKDGFVLIPSLFDAEEINLMRQAMEQDPALKQSLYERRDAQGKATRIALWNEPGDSVYGLAARSERVVDTIEDMLGAEVYHYHSKLTAKEPFDGGAWEWHQDYGYWYHNGCLFPHMASVMVALDRADRDNGCLQVIRGSHQAGRINHSTGPGEQVGADMERVDQMLKEMDLVYAEMAPGDGLFFHSNEMHRSDQNRSPNRRWTVLFCYNAAHNTPYKAQGHASYNKLDKVPDQAVKAAGIRLSDPAQSQFQIKKAHAAPSAITP